VGSLEFTRERPSGDKPHPLQLAETEMADDLDQAVLLITAVMVPLGLLPFLLARIEVWLAAPQQTRTAKPTPEGARGFVRGLGRGHAGTQAGRARVQKVVATTALGWSRTIHPRQQRRR